MKMSEKEKKFVKDLRKRVKEDKFEIIKGWGFKKGIYVDERKGGWRRIKVDSLSWNKGIEIINEVMKKGNELNIMMDVNMRLNVYYKVVEEIKEMSMILCIKFKEGVR